MTHKLKKIAIAPILSKKPLVAELKTMRYKLKVKLEVGLSSGSTCCRAENDDA
jgi:hypothetical protein